MRKAKKVSKEAFHPRLVRMAEREFKTGCPLCGPNKGCNKRSKGFQNDWKTHRKNQWRTGDE